MSQHPQKLMPEPPEQLCWLERRASAFYHAHPDLIFGVAWFMVAVTPPLFFVRWLANHFLAVSALQVFTLVLLFIALLICMMRLSEAVLNQWQYLAHASHSFAFGPPFWLLMFGVITDVSSYLVTGHYCWFLPGSLMWTLLLFLVTDCVRIELHEP